jgi:predicted HTH domain antitoxin
MHTLTTEDLARQPQRLLDEAARGGASLVTRAGEAVLLAVPLGASVDANEVRMELAARLYDSQQISLGVAARIAGLSYSEMIDALGARGIATIRLEPGDLERELAAFGP